MIEKSFSQIHHEHKGYVSDKWDIYLREYDRLFQTYREKPVRLLEIGVQNGGSLEVLGKYFPKAERLLGCDIDPDCGNLRYSDARIALVIGDATEKATRQRISGYVQALDIVIDDGSHRPIDIIRAFTLYFPMLENGGLYVVEDLHCSYWQEYSGGLFNPLSSIAFFKALADVLNGEHWGTATKRTEVLQDFFTEYGCSMSESDLEHVHSIEFINSMCVIRRSGPVENKSGAQRIAGQMEDVVLGRLALQGKYISPPDQTHNPWTISPRIQLQHLAQTLADKDGQVAELTMALVAKDAHIQELESVISAIKKSFSWRLTQPVRVTSSAARAGVRALSKCVTGSVSSPPRFSKLSNRFPLKAGLFKNKLFQFKGYIFKRIHFLGYIFTVFKMELLNKKHAVLVRDSPEFDYKSKGMDKSVAVVYLARGQSKEELDSINKFIASYKSHQSGCNHVLYVIFKGFNGPRSLENAKKKFDMPFKAFDFEDNNFDIGAFVEASRLVEEDIVIFLNTHSEIRSDEWMWKLTGCLRMNEIGLVGCTASFESLSCLSSSFPKSPNPHIRSNAFAIERKFFVEITRHEKIQSKVDAWLFESGRNSLTRRVRLHNKEAVVVDSHGKVYREDQWPVSGVFRHIFRQNELVSDNQCRLFKSATFLQRAKMSFFAWGGALESTKSLR